MSKIGIDLGSSYVDLALQHGGRVEALKIKADGRATSDAILHALDQACADWSTDLASVEEIRIGSTGAVNMLLNRQGARVGLITTRGFADTLALARQNRADLYEPVAKSLSPRFLVAPGCIREVGGRLDSHGTVLEPVSIDEIAAAAASLTAEGVEAIAICLLFSYLDPQQERECAAVIWQKYPSIPVVLSSEVDGAAREYERTVSTCLEAWLRPWHQRTLEEIRTGLTAKKFGGRLSFGDSRGFLLDPAAASELVINQIASGPAAAANAALAICRRHDAKLAIMMDIGSVSTDIALIERFEAGTTAHAVFAGVPLRQPMTDIVSVALGGRSAITISDSAVHFAPAGSEQAPCLGDALAWLDLVPGASFPQAAEKIEALAHEKALSPRSLAEAIRDAAVDTIAEAILRYAVGRAVDPASVTLVASGGLGAILGPAIVERLGASRVLVDAASPVAGALGLLHARHMGEDLVRVNRPLDRITDEELAGIFSSENGADMVHSMEVAPDAYMHPVRVPVAGKALSIEAMKSAYRTYHLSRFGYEPKAEAHLFSLAREKFEEVEPNVSAIILRGWEHGATESGAIAVEQKPTELRPRTLQMRLDAIAQGMQDTLFRTAVSPVVREGNDAAAALLTADGEIIALSDAIPLLLGALGGSLRAILEDFPASGMEEGDLFFMSDPYRGGTHLPDITVVQPVFAEGRLVCFAATMLHHQDIGGMRAGSVPPDAQDIFQEGLRVPPMRLGTARRIDGKIEDLIRCNSRTPDTVVGDLSSQVAAGLQAERALHRLIGEMGAVAFIKGVERCLDLGEQHARQVIASLPPGPFHAREMLDPMPGLPNVSVNMTLSCGGSTFRADFTGSSEQVLAPINCVRSGPFAASFYSLLSLMGPAAFRNGGVVRCIDLVLPEGSAVNASMPAAVNARTGIVRAITSTLLQALAQAAPDRMPAANSGMSYVLAFSGKRPNGAPFVSTEIIAGGAGGGPDADGTSGISTDVGNAMNMPAEALESLIPVRLLSASFKRGSGGKGRYRGGDGIRRIYEALQDNIQVSLRGERFHTVPPGVRGGGSPLPAYAAVERIDGTVEVLPTRSTPKLNRGDRLIVESCGGAGYGSPDEGMADR
jgi:N-methylhydantoinase B